MQVNRIPTSELDRRSSVTRPVRTNAFAEQDRIGARVALPRLGQRLGHAEADTAIATGSCDLRHPANARTDCRAP